MVNTIPQMLEPFGYRVTARTSGIEALEAFRNKPQGFDLVITDMTMPIGRLWVTKNDLCQAIEYIFGILIADKDHYQTHEIKEPFQLKLLDKNAENID